MKSLLFILGCTALLLAGTAQTTFAQSLKGKWKGESNGEVGMMSFDKEGYVTFSSGGETVGGKNFTSEGITMSMRYEADDTKDPATLDFVMQVEGLEFEAARMQGIYKFVNPKTLIVNMDFSGTHRPAKFDPEDPNQITLHKVKK